MNKRAAELAEGLRKQFSGPLSEEERTFLRDLQGFVEFAIRNGLSFAVIASTLGHDLNELARDLYALKQTKARGFIPKVTGYSQLTEENVGGSVEGTE